MKKIVSSEVITCDVCERIHSSCTEHIIDGHSLDLCPNCEHIFSNLVSGKNFEVALNMYQSIRVCLGKDSAEAYNKFWGKYNFQNSVNSGEWKEFQFHAFLQECAGAFCKMVGSAQSVAYPFEIRMKFKDLEPIPDNSKE